MLIESAYFAPASVRRTSKLLGLHTEASHRFERGTDYEGVLRAQERCVALICEIAGGTATEDTIDVFPRKFHRRLKSVCVPPASVRCRGWTCRLPTASGFCKGWASRKSPAQR